MGQKTSLLANNKVVATVAELDSKSPNRKRNSLGSISSADTSSSGKQHDIGKLMAMEAILKHDKFHSHFLKIISHRHKEQFVRHYEELEAIKKIIPNKKNDPRHTIASYKFDAIIQTSPTLKHLFETERISPEENNETISTTEAGSSSYAKLQKKIKHQQKMKNKMLILKSLVSLISFKETMISPEELHNLLTECQWSLLGYLTTEYDLFVRSNELQKVITSLSSNAIKEFYGQIHQIQSQCEKELPGSLTHQVSSILKDFPIPKEFCFHETEEKSIASSS